jgi:hypothetical protein
MGRQRRHLLVGVGDAGVLVTPVLGEVLLDLGGEHEDVLVHVRATEVGGVDGAPDGLDGAGSLAALAHGNARCHASRRRAGDPAPRTFG